MRSLMYSVVPCLVLAVWIANDATAQRGGFGRMGGRGPNSDMMERMQAVSTFPVDRIWHVLSIRMDTTDEQVLKLRAFAKEASTQKDLLMEQAEKSEDWSWLRDRLNETSKQFKENLNGVLSAEEMKTFEKLAEEAEQMPGGFGRFRR